MFDFLGNVGAKLFGKGKNEAEEIEKLLNKDLAGKIQGLKAAFAGGRLCAKGTTTFQQEKGPLSSHRRPRIRTTRQANPYLTFPLSLIIVSGEAQAQHCHPTRPPAL